MRKFLLIIFCWLSIFSAKIYAQELKVGDKLPDFTSPSLNGDSFSISSLSGNIIFIDFWASWCAPCRKRNISLVELYQKYKDIELENGKSIIFVSISLDFKQSNWERAIEKDGLIWDYHLSDLKGWKNETAVALEVKKIPYNILVDTDGTIIGINLTDSELNKRFKKLNRTSFFGFK